MRPLQYRSDSVNDHPLVYYVSTHHCGYHKSSGSHTTAVFVAVLLLLPTSSSTDRQQLVLYLRGTSLVVSTCHSRSDVQPTCRDHPIHVCTKLNIINFCVWNKTVSRILVPNKLTTCQRYIRYSHSVQVCRIRGKPRNLCCLFEYSPTYAP